MPKKMITARMCCICGKRKGSTSGFKTILAKAGFTERHPGAGTDKAHPACVAKFLKRESWEAKIARQLNAAMGTKLTEKDLQDWVGEDGAGPAYTKVDRVVRQYLGKGLYDAADQTARMLDVLEAVLAGKRTAKVGGIVFQNLQDRRGK